MAQSRYYKDCKSVIDRKRTSNMVEKGGETDAKIQLASSSNTGNTGKTSGIIEKIPLVVRVSLVDLVSSTSVVRSIAADN